MNLGPSLNYGIPVTLLATVVLCAMALNLPQTTTPNPSEETLETVSFECDSLPLESAAELFSQASGKQVLLTYGVAAQISVSYDAVPWRQALAHLARTAGCADLLEHAVVDLVVCCRSHDQVASCDVGRV